MGWRSVSARVRALPTRTLLGMIVVASLAAGLVAGRLGAERGALEEARALAERGRYGDADRVYLALAQTEPGDIPLLLELLDNHSLVAQEAGDAPVEALLLRLPPDVALLAEHWHHVLRNTTAAEERARVVAAADREPPGAWANDVLGREARRSGDRAEAAARFAREAREFDGRRADARLACELWVALDEWRSMDEALADARFERQLGPGDRLVVAAQRGQWTRALGSIIPAQCEGATPAIVLLGALSAAVWFAIGAGIGSFLPPRQRIPLHAAAFGLGVASGYLALAILVVQMRFFPSLGFGSPGARFLDCLVAVGPREELSKGLLALPALLWVQRWGRRGDALACGGLVGLGFAAAENVGYFRYGLSTALVRFLTANLFHIAATGLLAAAIDDWMRGRSTKGNGVAWTFAFLAVMHGVYDVFALLEGLSFV